MLLQKCSLWQALVAIGKGWPNCHNETIDESKVVLNGARSLVAEAIKDNEVVLN